MLYALALEKLFPGATVDGRPALLLHAARRLHARSTSRSTTSARDGRDARRDTLGDAIAQGFLPAAPAKDACEYCDYRPVCGPYEEQRVAKQKPQAGSSGSIAAAGGRDERRSSTPRRARASASDLDATLVVEAAAGTGKTTELVARIVACCAAGAATLERIVAVTFTEKAAGEMKLRLRAELEKARSDAATARAEQRRASTPRSPSSRPRASAPSTRFCADLLRERPVEARVDPLFEVAAEDEAERLFDAGVRRAGSRRARARRPRACAACCAARARARSDGPRERCATRGWKLVEHRDFDAPWRRDPFDRDGGDRRASSTSSRALARARAARARPDDYLAQGLLEIARFVAELERREAVARRATTTGSRRSSRELAR